MVGSLDAALARAGDGEVFVIGGSDLDEAALPNADRLYLTLVELAPEGDVLFPEFDWREWNRSQRTAGQVDEKERLTRTPSSRSNAVRRAGRDIEPEADEVIAAASAGLEQLGPRKTAKTRNDVVRRGVDSRVVCRRGPVVGRACRADLGLDGFERRGQMRVRGVER